MKPSARRFLVAFLGAALFAAWLVGPVRHRLANTPDRFGYTLAMGLEKEACAINAAQPPNAYARWERTSFCPKP